MTSFNYIKSLLYDEQGNYKPPNLFMDLYDTNMRANYSMNNISILNMMVYRLLLPDFTKWMKDANDLIRLKDVVKFEYELAEIDLP